MLKATTFVKQFKQILRSIFLYIGLCFIILFLFFIQYQIKNEGKVGSNYCDDMSYIFFALSPSIISLIYGIVFLYIKVKVKMD